MKVTLHNPYVKKEIFVEEDKKYYENELQRIYDNEIEFIIFTDAKTGNPITIRPSNWAMIEIEGDWAAIETEGNWTMIEVEE